MRNLIRFFSRYSFFFLFLLFELVCFYLLFRYNHFQQSSFLNSTNALSASTYASYSKLTDYLNLIEVNQALAKENELLRERQLLSYQKLFGPNYLVHDTLYQQTYMYTKARVINNSVNKQNNYLTLSIGTLNGIEKGMGVMGPSGIVGVITQTSPHYSTVLSILHRDAKVGSKLKGSEYFGSMQWDGKSPSEGVLNDIPNHVALSIGDTIVSSGYSAIFPADVPLAVISEFDKPSGENFYDIRVTFTTDFRNLGYVYVVKNIHREEIKTLESNNQEPND